MGATLRITHTGGSYPLYNMSVEDRPCGTATLAGNIATLDGTTCDPVLITLPYHDILETMTLHVTKGNMRIVSGRLYWDIYATVTRTLSDGTGDTCTVRQTGQAAAGQ